MPTIADEMRLSPWLICLPARKTRRCTLIGFPHAGGGASCFHRLFRDLRSEIEVIGVQLPGRENRVRESVSRNLSCLVRDIVDNLAPVLRYKAPFVFFGHSFGALLAFEVTRRLRAKQLSGPTALIISGRTPPHLPLGRAALYGLADEDLLREVARLDGIPQEIQNHAEMCQLILGPLRADLKLDETYVYNSEQPLECPILACCGHADPEAPLCAMREWRQCTRSRFVFRVFDGGHFYIHTSLAPFAMEILSFLQGVVPGAC